MASFIHGFAVGVGYSVMILGAVVVVFWLLSRAIERGIIWQTRSTDHLAAFLAFYRERKRSEKLTG